MQQSFPPKSKFSVDDIPDLSGRVVIVTGAWVSIQILTPSMLKFASCRWQCGHRLRNRQGTWESFPASPVTERRLTVSLQALLQHNARVYLAARSKEKAENAIASLKEATGKEAIFLELDLGSLSAVKKSADEFLSKEKELHILFNNA